MVQKVLIAVMGLALVGAATFYFLGGEIPAFGGKPVSTAKFLCDADKSITATFYESRVVLELSDFRSLTYPQLTSASGARYGSEDESFVFWNSGDAAFITESGTETFSNCEMEIAGQVSRATYTSREMGVIVKYPRTYRLDTAYRYEGVPNKPIPGVKFLVPLEVATGTNLRSSSFRARSAALEISSSSTMSAR
jgi:membrane-bound inhibitor of C-type lysozyme